MKKKMSRTMTTTVLSIMAMTLAFSVSTVSAQSLQVPRAPHAGITAITNAIIHPVSSPDIDLGYIVYKNGLITEVGEGEFDPGNRDIEILDGHGLHFYPGLISADTVLGLTEIGAVHATNDRSEIGAMTPEVRASVAVNPDSALIPVTRANGILTMNVIPGGGQISGFSSIMRLDGWTTEEMTIIDRAALVVRWPNVRPSRAWWASDSPEDQVKQAQKQLDAIDQAFRDAAAYLKSRNENDDAPIDIRLEAFRPVLERQHPLLIAANDSAQIRSAIAWTERLQLDMVLLGGRQAHRCLDLLKKHHIPVILAGTLRMPSRRDSNYDEAYALPNMLHQAGISFCIASGGEAAHERSMPYNAAMAVAYGLPEDVALRSITLSAAELLGIGQTHGSIEPGKVATFIITTGSPLEITTEILAAFIDGSQVDLGSKQKSLYEKYRTRYEQLGRLNATDEATADESPN